MATNESMMIRCNAALERLEDALLALEGSEPLAPNAPRPIKRLWRDREMLRVMQLETLATWLEEIVSKPSIGANETPVKPVKRKAG